MKRAGFTLLEISVVIGIIGLIIGGLIVGQGLIRAAELNEVMSDVQKYKSAVEQFEVKYDSLPGDMPNASDYWSSCTDDAGPPVNNCDGNGDGAIQFGVPAGNGSEGFRAWEHLAGAGLISGNYDGSYNSGAEYINPGVNMPEVAAFPGGLYHLVQNSVGLRLGIGAIDPDTTDDALPNEVIISAEESYFFDEKLDDGLPFSGHVQALEGWDAPNCVTGGSPIEYDISDDSKACAVYFFLRLGESF